MPQSPINSRKRGSALVFWQPIRFLWRVTPGIFHELHAPIPLFPANSARNAKRGRDCLASIDAARRHDAAGGGGHLRLSAPRLPRVAEDLPDRAGGTEPVGCDRVVNAHGSVGGSLARERTLRRVWQGNAAHKGSAWARDALRSDQ